MAKKLQQALRRIGKTCAASNLTEAEVEKVFQDEGFFLELGYEGFGKDILAQRTGRSRKRFDVALLGFGGRVHAIIEFKQKNAGPLDSFSEKLYAEYVKPQLALFGVLTNGLEMLVYARSNGEFPEQLTFKLSEGDEQQAQKIQTWLAKRIVHLDSLESVLGLLKLYRQNALLLSDPNSEEARIFFQVFQLRPGSAFGRLAQTLKDLLLRTVESSRFARGSYEFWLKTYARELKFKDIPDTWRPFLGSKSSPEIASFSFSLETAYTIVSRLILAKAADDRRFPGVRFLPRINESLNELATRGKLKHEDYLRIVHRSFERASETLFSSIFLQDIFDWWFECPPAESGALHHALGEAMLAVCQFSFEDLSGDFLGELYQRYFDRDTRKALGEFYTPPEAIEFILDECGYHGQRGNRLLDPACGSGSFLVAALRRYLGEATGPKKDILLDLTEGLRIVGFDINPFAVLMSQVNYAALILPLYAEAIYDDPDFRIVRLPVFRTDSLRIEEREGEWRADSKEKLQVSLQFEEATLKVSVYLPLKAEKKGFVKMTIKVPRYGDAREKNLVANLEEYVAALARTFQAVRDRRHPLESLLKSRFGEGAGKLQAYLQPALQGLEETIGVLKDKYDDGRFLKTIEDLVLAVSLKHDRRYDFVVGNPPYVRIQKIPEHVKESWAGQYEWAEHNYDLYVPFLERASRSADGEGWLGKKGRLGFILSDRFLNVDYGRALREHMPESMRVDLLFDFRDTRVFADALNYPAILIAERSDEGKDGGLSAARVFTSEADAQEIMGELQVLRKELAEGKIARGRAVEVFKFPRQRLTGSGWWLMPSDELRLFDKLRSNGKRLMELTATTSGGFAGYQTSADTVLVFDEEQDSGLVLKLWPRHEGNGCGCGKKPVEIEKGALRPFLFGRDVARWAVDWKRSWVLFPYDRYPRHKTVEGKVIEEWNLIPCKANKNEFEFLDPKGVEPFEDRFPKAWKYLSRHEAKLRAREDRRYEEGERDAHLWYGAARPQNLDYFFRPKLVLQVLSRCPSVTVDPEGRFVFTAGGTAGVYGIVLKESSREQLLAVAAVLNSRAADFCVKQISSVFGSRYYSYGDQFIADIVLPTESPDHQLLPNIAGKLLDLTAKVARHTGQITSFPEGFGGHLARYELDTIKHLAMGHPASAQLSIEPEAISVERTLYGFEILCGRQRGFGFHDREHAECLAEALRNRNRKTLALEEVLNWRLPVKPEGCKKLLSLLSEARKELEKTAARIASEEDELNDVVYALYKVNPAERQVIEGFLARYSSQAATAGPSGLQVEENDSATDE